MKNEIWTNLFILTALHLATSTFIDYNLYSQIQTELGLGEDLEPQTVFNYYKLNNDTLNEFNNYLYFPQSERIHLKDKAKSMLEFAYDNYIKYAYPKDELDPIHCTGRGPDHNNPSNININDSLGDYLLTLVESLSTLVVVGNSSEFKKASKLVIDNLDFNKDNTVQVFETTIRILGSLLTAHLVVADKNQPFGDMKIPNYNNEFLNLAHDLGVRLLTAFDKKDDTDIPYPRINLKKGVPENSYSHTCTSGAGTLVLEFGVLGHLVNDSIYENVARKAVKSIFNKRDNNTGLIGNELNIHSGTWQNQMSGLGAGIDSFFEYLMKSYILFGQKNDLEMYEELNDSIKKHIRRGREDCLNGEGMHPFYVNVNMNNGQLLNNWIDSLQASHAGVQVLEGDLSEAICFHSLYYAIWKKFGVLPERYNWNLKLPDVYFYPLRPEFAETTYFLYRSTHSPFYLHVAKEILNNIEKITKVKCGYATVHDVLDKSLEDRMESFFISETLKYLYLTFDVENHLNNKGEVNYVFTTEGHFFPIKSTFKSFNQRIERSDNKKKESLSLRSLSKQKKFIKKSRKKKQFTQCDLKMSQASYLKLHNSLPLSINKIARVFDIIGVNDNIESLLDRKSV